MNKMISFQKPAFREMKLRRTMLLKIGTMMAIVPFLCLILAMPTLAQKTSGQISGSVVDQSGAAVPETSITVIQVGTGIERTVTTSDEGVYTIPDLPIGTYRMSATRSGFKAAITENVVVNVATTTRQDLTLEVGSVDQQVTINADALQVETQTGAIGEVITGQQVRELPLNGRSFVQLTQLQPGVAPQNNFDSKNKGLFSGVDFSVNGNSAQSNLFLTDGANNNDTGSNRTILLYPSIEAIAEFKMLRNSYGPEYGQAAGSVISIVTRGGENEFHGSLFYFGRNDALNATEFFARRSGTTKDKLRRNDFGFSIGGPLPFLNFGEGGPVSNSGKDRLFFFYSQEWNKEIRGGTRFGNVPTLAERNGDFRDASRRGCNGGAIGNGRPGSDTQVIPQSQINPAGLLLAQLYPLPNLASGAGDCTNWSQSLNSKIDFREENVRIDYNVNKKNQVFGRYTQDHWTNPFPILFGAGLWGDDPFPGVESSWAQPSKQAAIKLTSTLSNTAVNEVQFSYSANRITVDPGTGGDLNRSINTAIPGYFPDSAKVNGLDRPHPVFWGGIQPFTSNRGADLWTQAPFRNSLDIYSIRDDFSKVAGNHSLKMGFLFDKAKKIEDSGPNNETAQFWGACCSNNSGNYLADVLTRGSVFGFSESDRQAVGNTKYDNLEFYLGDTWKVRPNVTLELGVRYSILYEPYDDFNAISSFDPARYNPARPATDPCNGLVVPKGAGNPCAGIAGASTPIEFSNRSLRDNNYKNFAPRLGVAWDVFGKGKTALRAGFGQFFLRERVSPVVAALTSNPPFVRSVGGNRTLDATPVFSNLPASAGAGAPAFSWDPRATTPYSFQFNVTFDQELWNGAVLEVGYVGNRARNQLTQYDINAVLPQNRVAAAFAADANAVNALRAYSNFGSIYQFSRRGRADYNSLQVLFKTRFLKNSQLQAAYTYSKSKADFGLGDSSGGRSDFALQDVNNPDLDYGPSDINRPHLFVANAVVNLPTFNGSNSFVKTVLGGWEFASIVQIASGTSLTPNIGATGLSYDLDGPGPGTETRNFQAGFSGTGTAVANQRPNLTGEPCSSDEDATQFINPNAFTLVGTKIGQPGNSPRGGCLGSPIKNVDFSLYKNFSPSWLKNSFLGEGARVQFRLEMFNAFNKAQFRGDSIGINYYNGRVVCGTAACSPTNNTITGVVGTPQANFGRAGNTRGGREIQYALKLNF
ncbi:MAG: Plug and carboxypeptidase regulatory-like domain-containing protein [Acidobacteriota bacterium]|nr:Plug and carboxypeptidase regulatory-like domain-containing protein [Acidobacteriota bacterium]